MLGLGSEERDGRPGKDPLELERLNHLVGLLRNEVKPLDGDAERGKLSEPPGERAPCDCSPASGGLNVLIDGAPRRGAMAEDSEGGQTSEPARARGRGQTTQKCEHGLENARHVGHSPGTLRQDRVDTKKKGIGIQSALQDKETRESSTSSGLLESVHERERQPVQDESRCPHKPSANPAGPASQRRLRRGAGHHAGRAEPGSAGISAVAPAITDNSGAGSGSDSREIRRSGSPGGDERRSSHRPLLLQPTTVPKQLYDITATRSTTRDGSRGISLQVGIHSPATPPPQCARTDKKQCSASANSTPNKSRRLPPPPTSAADPPATATRSIAQRSSHRSPTA